jgi:hypothetical protein
LQIAQCLDLGERSTSQSGHISQGWTSYSSLRKGNSLLRYPGSLIEAMTKAIAVVTALMVTRYPITTVCYTGKMIVI